MLANTVMKKYVMISAFVLLVAHGTRYFDPYFRPAQRTIDEPSVHAQGLKTEEPVSPEPLYGVVKDSSAQASPVVGPYRDWSVHEPFLSARYAHAIDLKTGYVFYQKGDKNAVWPVASITKLMTALVIRDTIDEHARILVNDTALATEGIAGGLLAGDEYAAGDLVKIMLLTSSNDAAVALAEYVGKDVIGQRMQEKARQIGMRQSIFVEPTGLSEANQSSSHDLRILMNHIYNTAPELLAVTAAPSQTVMNYTTKQTRAVHNINHFAGRSNFIGGKTGFIDTSGENLISLFQYQGYVIMTTVLGSLDRFDETETLLEFIKKGYRF